VNLYLAAVYTNNFTFASRGRVELNEEERVHRKRLEFILESYHYIHRQRFVDMIREDGYKIFLDSGAFSAFFGGVEIDIDGYCDYIKRNNDIIEVASVLDGIGDPQKTYDNQIYMESQGVRPLPCFHYGEDPRYLEWYIENYEHITLGGMVPISTPQLQLWLDEIWDKYLTNTDGSAKIRVHGFGMTALSLMKRYPWYSVDSSSWVQIANFGNILLPTNNSILSVSEESPAIKEHNKHLFNLPPMQRDALIEYIEAQGFTVDRLATNFVFRQVWNMFAFREINKRVNEQDLRFKREQQTLF